MVGGYESLSGLGLNGGCYDSLNVVTAAQKAPSAGADFSVAVPDADAPWQLVSLRAVFTTSAVVANRFVAAIVKDAQGNEVYRVGFGTALVASTAYVVTLGPWVSSAQGDVTNTKTVTLPLPDGPYLPRFTIGSVTTAIDVGDAYSALQAWYVAALPNGDSGADE